MIIRGKVSTRTAGPALGLGYDKEPLLTIIKVGMTFSHFYNCILTLMSYS